jgi:hypothetical protein
MTVNQVKDLVPYVEFLAWREFFRRESRERDKFEFYSAAIRTDLIRLRRTLVSIFQKPTGPEPTLETSLLNYADDSVGGVRPGDPDYLEMSKAAWMSFLSGGNMAGEG